MCGGLNNFVRIFTLEEAEHLVESLTNSFFLPKPIKSV